MKARAFGVIIVLDKAAPDGVTNQAIELARYLKSEGASVFMLVGRADRPLDEMPGVEVRFAPEAFKPFFGWFALRRLASEFTVGYRVVHAASSASLPCAEALAKRLSLPVIVTIHRAVQKKFAKTVRESGARWVVAVSDSVRSALANETGVERGRLLTIPDGVSPARYPVSIPKLDGKRRPVVGTLARLVPEKGVAVFLRAAALINQEAPGAEFVVAGRGPEEKRLSSLTTDLGLREHVTFLFDYVPPSSVIPVFDVFVSASLEEGLGLGIIEAAACGKPVVATSVGGVFDTVIDGKTGFIVPPNDPKAISTKVLYLLSHPAEAAAMGAEARDFVAERFNIAKSGKAYIDLYESLEAAKT
jgi:glycosyltransferase involved in cell wall biosynthesis